MSKPWKIIAPMDAEEIVNLYRMRDYATEWQADRFQKRWQRREAERCLRLINKLIAAIR